MNNFLQLVHFLQISIQFDFGMGQTSLQKIQSSVVDLRENNEIQLEQAQQFVKDYISSEEKIKDINYFMQTSSIDLFLKYFINYTYSYQSQEECSSQMAHKKIEHKNEITLIKQVLDTGCSELALKSDTLLDNLLKIYISQQSQIVSIRQKIKDMIITLFEIQSYRYYNYQATEMRETNSKILYLYQTSKATQIYKYASERKNNCSSSNLDEVIKQIYPTLQHICFQIQNSNGLSIIIFQINIQKWKFGKCLPLQKMKKILSNIAKLFSESALIIFDPQSKRNQLVPKNIFAKITLNLLELSIMVQSARIDTLLKSINTVKSKKQLLEEMQFKQTRQKIREKIRTWQYYVSLKSKMLILHFNYDKQLEFFYINQDYGAILKTMFSQCNSFSEFMQFLLPQDKRTLKKLNKILNSQTGNRKITLDSSISIFINRSVTNTAMYSISLVFELNEGSKIQKSLKIRNRQQLREIALQKDKFLIKRIKIEHPNISQTGWFKVFLQNQQNMRNSLQQNQAQKRKNNMKLPRLNKQYRISKFKTLYSLDDLKQQIEIDNQNLNLLQFNLGKLQIFVLKIFSRLSYFRSLPHQKDQFPNFLREVHLDYEKNGNKFHNFIHAVNVMHTCYLFCDSSKNNQLMTPFDKFTIIFSGLCHDVGHTGFTNLFQIARQSQFALIYNNKSPLQNYHASRTFQLLRKPSNNFLTSLDQKDFKKFRQLTISNILLTDIKQHFNLMKRFQKQKNTISNDDIKLLAGMIVHASDFGGSVKAFEVCKKWSLLVNQQFSKQYHQQGRLGLPQTPFMKDLNRMSILAKNQCGFLKVIVQPLYKQITEYYQDQNLNRFLKNVQNNIQQWDRLMQQSKD